MEENNNLEGIIRFGEYEKNISFPNDYNSFLEEIINLFQIPQEKKSKLIVNYKNSFGNSSQIATSEEYSLVLQKMSNKEISNIISISFPEFFQNKIKQYREDIYDVDDEEDKDELFLRQGHIFSKNQKQQSEFNGAGMDINKILNESIEVEKEDENNINNINNINNKNNIIFKNDIVKSVLPPMASFPTYCNICQKFPIVKIMYYCNNCHLNLCEDCEKNLGYNHRHCYYKIRNKEQFQEIMKMEYEKEDIKSKNNIDSEKEKKRKKKRRN